MTWMYTLPENKFAQMRIILDFEIAPAPDVQKDVVVRRFVTNFDITDLSFPFTVWYLFFQQPIFQVMYRSLINDTRLVCA